VLSLSIYQSLFILEVILRILEPPLPRSSPSADSKEFTIQ
jgi:hypothetical protein